MKLIHLTDPHLVPPGRALYGLDPAQRLAAAIAHIQARHTDAEACIITGDLAHRGDPQAYELLRELLAPLPMPVLTLIGNHDDRERFCCAFDEVPRDAGGFVQWVHATSAGRLILLDTVKPTAHASNPPAGYFDSGRARWLHDRLDEAGQEPVFLCMHHPPFGVGVRAFDDINLLAPDAQAFAEVVTGRKNIRHLFFGHIHRPIFGSWRGIPYSTLPATAHQSMLDFVASDDCFTHEPPAYGVVMIDADQITVHLENYLDHSPVYHPDGRCLRY
ncbi:phosphodiesterase [Acidihalobacter ferrooxydans]|uniref:Calcineurin-like phosphoesterase domain-containing protein n=1 Tax=Acidihalobacter ferrooxydans TaxID=1765967 RepID=A0A1P8UHH7_9GAMM|nr:phosphodiesterase [Acidihalobacter ferrooxydans]APZ43286.1 hypothetical protein BW247_09415 [Acidihalobacter ferrooxydans]